MQLTNHVLHPSDAGIESPSATSVPSLVVQEPVLGVTVVGGHTGQHSPGGTTG